MGRGIDINNYMAVVVAVVFTLCGLLCKISNHLQNGGVGYCNYDVVGFFWSNYFDRIGFERDVTGVF